MWRTYVSFKPYIKRMDLQLSGVFSSVPADPTDSNCDATTSRHGIHEIHEWGPGHSACGARVLYTCEYFTNFVRAIYWWILHLLFSSTYLPAHKLVTVNYISWGTFLACKLVHSYEQVNTYRCSVSHQYSATVAKWPKYQSTLPLLLFFASSFTN
jgi:hypothetical protein